MKKSWPPNFTDDEIADLVTILRHKEMGPSIRLGVYKIKFDKRKGWIFGIEDLIGWRNCHAFYEWRTVIAPEPPPEPKLKLVAARHRR